MGLFSFFKKKAFFSEQDQARIVAAITSAEKSTSGEIRLFVESKNPYMDPLQRAAEIFFQSKMENTVDRNGVLLYIALKDRELALFGDEGTEAPYIDIFTFSKGSFYFLEHGF